MEVEGDVEYKKCPLCEKWIEASKFRMHEIGCSRQNYKCRECGMCVAKADKEDHEEEEHAIIQCKYCAFSAPKYNYKDHDQKCQSQPKACPFCGKMIDIVNFQDHYTQCGSKTEKCETCGDYVRLMDKEQHLATNQCQVVLERKKKEEEAEQRRKLEEFQREREREIAKKKEMDAKRKAEEAERQRKREERDRQYEQQHGLDDFSEFDDVRHGGIQRPAASQHKQQARAPISNSVRQNAPQINTRQQNNARPAQQQQIGSYMRSGANKPGGAAGVGQRANSRQKMEEKKMPGASGASRMTGGNRPVINNSKSKPVPNNREPEKLPSMASVQQRQQRAQQQMPGPMGGGERNFASGPGSRMAQPPGRTSKKPEPAPKQSQQPLQNNEPGGDVLNDYDQMIFNQFLDEDESHLMAQQLQNEMYGGSNANPGGPSQPYDDGGLGIRKADSEREMQLIGGMDDSPMRPRQRQRQQQRQQPDAIMDDDWGAGPAQQNYGGGLPNDPVQAMNSAAMHYDQNFGAPVDENEAMIAKAIEESLRNQQHQPPSNYNEEEELQRILEMSKNMQ